MEINAENLFRLLADGTRLRCLVLLVEHEEVCVCELTFALGLSQPKISRHLAQLRDAGLVADRRQGLWVYYRLNPDLPGWVRNILQEIHDSSHEQAPFITDRDTLAGMPNRPGTSCCA